MSESLAIGVYGSSVGLELVRNGVPRPTNDIEVHPRFRMDLDGPSSFEKARPVAWMPK